MFSFAMTFTSCSDEAFDVDSVNKQTILVYYPWTGSTTSSGLKQYLANNIDSICRAIAVVLVGLHGHTVHLPAGGIVLQIVECALVVFLAEKYHHT